MTSQMSEMQREVDDKLKIEDALKKAEQAHKEACALIHVSPSMLFLKRRNPSARGACSCHAPCADIVMHASDLTHAA